MLFIAATTKGLPAALPAELHPRSCFSVARNDCVPAVYEIPLFEPEPVSTANHPIVSAV